MPESPSLSLIAVLKSVLKTHTADMGAKRTANAEGVDRLHAVQVCASETVSVTRCPCGDTWLV